MGNKGCRDQACTIKGEGNLNSCRYYKLRFFVPERVQPLFSEQDTIMHLKWRDNMTEMHEVEPGPAKDPGDYGLEPIQGLG